MPAALLDRPDTVTSTQPLADAYHRLTTLQHGHVEGWYRYIGADTARGLGRQGRRDNTAFVVELENGQPRGLTDHDLPWWVLGAGCGYGRGQEILDLLDQRPPRLLTLDEASEKLSRSVPALKQWLNGGRLYPVHANIRHVNGTAGWQRYVFAAQVGAILQRRHAVARWAEIRPGLPDLTRLEHLADPPVLAPSPDPLPIAPARWPGQQRQALQIGHDHGWFRYLGGQPLQASATFDVEIGGEPLTLPGAGVLPWVLGVADRWGQGLLVTYRAGQG